MQENAVDNQVEEAGVRVRDWSSVEFFGILWRRRMLILLIVIMAAGCGLVYVSLVRPTYKCTTRLYVEKKGPRIITEQEGVMTQSKNYLYSGV